MLVATKVAVHPLVELATWAGVWASAVAVDEMCVKWGRGGNTNPRSQWISFRLIANHCCQKPIAAHSIMGQ